MDGRQPSPGRGKAIGAEGAAAEVDRQLLKLTKRERKERRRLKREARALAAAQRTGSEDAPPAGGAAAPLQKCAVAAASMPGALAKTSAEQAQTLDVAMWDADGDTFRDNASQGLSGGASSARMLLALALFCVEKSRRLARYALSRHERRAWSCMLVHDLMRKSARSLHGVLFVPP